MRRRRKMGEDERKIMSWLRFFCKFFTYFAKILAEESRGIYRINLMGMIKRKAYEMYEGKGGSDMKVKTTFLIIFLILALVITGCESMGPKTKTGAVAGGVLGAAAGGIIGYQTGHPLAGAGIGAAVGALGGALIGNAMDQKDKEAMAVNPNHIPLTKIAEMASQGTPDDIIISEIDRTHSVYQLTAEIITYLKQHKVSDKVIDHMMATAK